eukprot:m.65341 g.65341  ORF g.65341 m.65341 type:complete len:271 (-) comp11527_c3_seq1:422-1234(-)
MGGKGSKAKKEKGTSDKETSITFEENGSTKVETKAVEKKKSKRDKSKKEKKDTSENGEKKPKEVGRVTSKKVASRLGGNLGIDFGDDDFKSKKKEEKQREKLFQAPKEEAHSRIFNALNPQKLYFESRRDKEEAEEEKVEVDFEVRDYGFHRDDDGNVVEDDDDDDDEVDEDNDDPETLPDFGEFQEEMNKLQKQREAKHHEHQKKLREEYLAKKKKEDEEREKELERIRKVEAEIAAAKVDNKEGFVEEAQERVAKETDLFLKSKFSFK